MAAAGELTPISLGPNCGTSKVLDTLGLRLAAYPFDWLYSSLAMIEHCLDDDFRTFLDASQIEPIHKRRSNHRFYFETFNVERVFNHHQMPKEMPHFERAVDRFRTASRPVFVHIVRQRPDRELLARLRTKLHGPLLVYAVNPKARQPGFQNRDGITRFQSIARFTSFGFQEAVDAAQFSARLLGDLTTLVGELRVKSPSAALASAPGGGIAPTIPRAAVSDAS